MKKIYITGPTFHENKSDWFELKRKLNEKGYDCSTALEFHTTKDFKKSIGLRIQKLLKCDAIITLEGWYRSDECNLEIQIARMYNIPVHHFTIIIDLEQCSQTKANS